MVRLNSVLLTCATAVLASAQCALETSAKIETAEGVQYKLLFEGLGRPRHLVVDSEGNLLVVNGGVRRIVLDGSEGLDVCTESDSQLVENEALNHGIALTSDGSTLFLTSRTEIVAYEYDAVAGTVSGGRTVLTGMDANSTHSSRTLLIPHETNPDLLLVAGGSNGNIDPPTMEIETARSQVRVFNIADLLATDSPANYADGTVMGWGLRNSVGWAEDPSTGYIWSVENSADNLERGGVDIHNSNPGEELNFHGFPNETSDNFGANYGYPGCFSIYDTSVVEDYPGGAVVGKQMAAIEAGGQDLGFTDETCQEKVAPRLTFGSHLAPLDIKFQDGSAAYIAFHGSWNRSPGDGYRLSRIDFEGGEPAASSDSHDAEVPIMWNSDNSECPAGCFRPCGLAFDGKSRLFVTSDATGELYVLTGV